MVDIYPTESLTRLPSRVFTNNDRKTLGQRLVLLQGRMLYEIIKIIKNHESGKIDELKETSQWVFDMASLDDRVIEEIEFVVNAAEKEANPNLTYLREQRTKSKHIFPNSSKSLEILATSASLETVGSQDNTNNNLNVKSNKTKVAAQKMNGSRETMNIGGVKVIIVDAHESETGKRQLECSVCNKRFRAKGEMIVHVRTHTGEKPLKCPTCGKRFAHPSNLKAHERSHLGLKPFKCDWEGCNKTFAHSASLKEHIYVHTGERPFKCDVCGFGFRSRSNLAKHRKRIHKAVGGRARGPKPKKKKI